MKYLFFLIAVCFFFNCTSETQNTSPPKVVQPPLNDSVFNKLLYYYFKGKIGEDSVSLYLVKHREVIKYIDGYLIYHKDMEPIPISANYFMMNSSNNPPTEFTASTYADEQKYNMKSVEISGGFNYYIKASIEKAKIIGEMRAYNSEDSPIPVNLTLVQDSPITFRSVLCVNNNLANNFLIPQGLPTNSKLIEEITKVIFYEKVDTNNICDYSKRLITDTVFTIIKMSPIFINEKYINMLVFKDTCNVRCNRSRCNLQKICIPFSIIDNRRMHLADIIDMRYKDSLISVLQRNDQQMEEEYEKTLPEYARAFQAMHKAATNDSIQKSRDSMKLEELNLIIEKENFYITDTGLGFMYYDHGNFSQQLELFIPFAAIKSFLKK